MFAIFILAKLDLALVSTLSVVLFIVKGPRGEDAAESLGYLLKLIVICALPVSNLKSGINLLILINISPSPKSKSHDCINAGMTVLLPAEST